MFDKNPDEFWADLIIQEERDREGVPNTEFLLPISGSIDDIASSPLDFQESKNTSLEIAGRNLSPQLFEFSREEYRKLPRNWKRFRANPDQSKRLRWTSEEDQIIMDFYLLRGANWKQISKELQGRAPDAIKNRFYGTLKKRMTEEQKRLLSRRIKCDWPIEIDLPVNYEQEETISSVSTDPIISEAFALSESNNQLTAQDKRRKVQELHNKMIALQAIISKTQREISNLKEM